jgi:hypothetical protein
VAYGETLGGMGKWAAYFSALSRETFREFSWARDIIVALGIDVVTLLLTAHAKLITPHDWQQHWLLCMIVILAPYVVVIGGQIAWKVIASAVFLHHEARQEAAALRAQLQSQVVISEMQPGDPKIEVKFVSQERGYLEVVNRGTKDIFWIRVFPLPLHDITLAFDHIEARLVPRERTTFSPYVGTQWGTEDNRHHDFIRALSENWVTLHPLARSGKRSARQGWNTKTKRARASK